MESSNFDEEGNDEILVFVNLGYYVPEDTYKELNIRLNNLENMVELLLDLSV